MLKPGRRNSHARPPISGISFSGPCRGSALPPNLGQTNPFSLPPPVVPGYGQPFGRAPRHRGLEAEKTPRSRLQDTAPRIHRGGETSARHGHEREEHGCRCKKTKPVRRPSPLPDVLKIVRCLGGAHWPAVTHQGSGERLSVGLLAPKQTKGAHLPRRP